jgi:hypothetical protein
MPIVPGTNHRATTRARGAGRFASSGRPGGA